MCLKVFLYGPLLELHKKTNTNMVLKKSIAWGNMLLIQLGIKTPFYRNTERNNSYNIKHDDQRLLCLF